MSEDTPPAEPSFDADWEEHAEQVLADTEFDTELGIELAKDAQNVVDGGISEQEFFDRYHGRIIEEFGEDDRELPLETPTGGDEDGKDLSLRDRLAELAEDEQTRREIMKKGGAAAIALSVLGGASNNGSAAGEQPASDGTRWGMVINLNNCDGCLACMSACAQEHGLSRGANWMYVLTYQDEDQDDENFLVRPCQHCTDSPCTKVCPVGARHTRTKDGLVLTDYDICIGCRYCQVSCPYGVNYFQWGDPDVPDADIPDDHQIDDRGKWVGARPPTGVMGKCTFCVDRQDGQMGDDRIGTTACEDACVMNAIHFGDLNDPESAPNQHLESYRDQQANDLSDWPNRKEHTVSTFKLLEERGTDPNIHYIGNEPSQHARQVEGPVTYDDVGLVDNRKKEVLDKGAATNAEGEEA